MKTAKEIANEYADHVLADALAEEIESYARQQNEELYKIFEWLLGYHNFPEREDGQGVYYWRTHLRSMLENTGFDEWIESKE